MDTEELLAQLADIHLPPAISYWPPAPGWWVLACVVIALLVFAGNKVALSIRQRKICQYALAELERCYRELAQAEDQESNSPKLRFVNQFNSVLRRVALYHFPQSNVASLGGVAWVDFIRKKGDSSLLNDEISQALSYGRFQTEIDVDVDALHNLGQQWISSLYASKNEPASAAQGLSA
jgi:hypothetical protein